MKTFTKIWSLLTRHLLVFGFNTGANTQQTYHKLVLDVLQFLTIVLGDLIECIKATVTKLARSGIEHAQIQP